MCLVIHLCRMIGGSPHLWTARRNQGTVCKHVFKAFVLVGIRLHL